MTVCLLQMAAISKTHVCKIFRKLHIAYVSERKNRLVAQSLLSPYDTASSYFVPSKVMIYNTKPLLCTNTAHCS